MKNSFSIWLKAARLRTLPLSVSGVIVGNALCLSHPNFSILLFILMMLTAMAFQIISNFANDYGDWVKGTDNIDRVGPKRVLQQGLLSRKDMKKGILITSIISLLLSITTVGIAFGSNSPRYLLIFIGFSGLSVWAAISYTVGKKAYGYNGLGDLFVFLFFGCLSVLGSYFIQLKSLSENVFYLSIALGFLSVGVLNLNNMRDRESDALVGKNTLVVLLGKSSSKFYHLILLIFSIIIIIYVSLSGSNTFFWLPFIAFIPLLLHFRIVLKNKDPKKLDPELKKLALSTFFFSILIFITYFIG